MAWSGSNLLSTSLGLSSLERFITVPSCGLPFLLAAHSVTLALAGSVRRALQTCRVRLEVPQRRREEDLQ